MSLKDKNLLILELIQLWEQSPIQKYLMLFKEQSVQIMNGNGITSSRDAVAVLGVGDGSDLCTAVPSSGHVGAASLKLCLDEISSRVRLGFSRESGFR